ncbi:hypothetical protein BDN67DRAFT_668611 [Paxillus ammoniavirescens]|nr:hypothetical protein BDN67DRAFT_668611 [Paxillus ammoniavirescens]
MLVLCAYDRRVAFLGCQIFHQSFSYCHAHGWSPTVWDAQLAKIIPREEYQYPTCQIAPIKSDHTFSCTTECPSFPLTMDPFLFAPRQPRAVALIRVVGLTPTSSPRRYDIGAKCADPD